MKMTFVHVYNTLHIHTVHPGLYSTIFLAEGPSFVDTTPPSASYTQQQWKVHANSEIICGEIRNALHNPFPPFWERHAGSSALCWRAVKPNATHEILYNPGKGCTVGRVFMRSLWNYASCLIPILSRLHSSRNASENILGRTAVRRRSTSKAIRGVCDCPCIWVTGAPTTSCNSSNNELDVSVCRSLQ